MTSVAFESYMKAECPKCGTAADLDEVAVDASFHPTFYYLCPYGHQFWKFRPRPLDEEEFERVILFTKQHQ